MNDTIERDVFIRAGIDRVWSLVSLWGLIGKVIGREPAPISH